MHSRGCRSAPSLPALPALPALHGLSILLLLPVLLAACSGDPDPGDDDDTDILEQLQQIDGLTVEEATTDLPGYRFFVMEYLQPADHDLPDGLRFSQRLTLLHHDDDAPMVLYTGGYFVSTTPRVVELTQLLEANQLSIEHRFFQPSRPDPTDWGLLTIEQSASDFHRITDAFKPLYPAAWVGTGGSKGGMTSVFHRRFYPDDVDATVAYAAPISLEPGDDRYITVFDHVGEPACNDLLTQFQRESLLRREAMVSMMLERGAAEGLTYDLLGPDMIVEHATLELNFYFWQYFEASWCEDIPDSAASDDEVYTFLDTISDLGFYADQVLEGFEPYFYQASEQLGYPAVDEAPFADLLLYPGTDIAPTYVFEDLPLSYDPTSMPEILSWIDEEGSRLMLIYGENDPWTAGAIPLGQASDSYRYDVPLGNHRSKIMDLPDPDRSAALETRERWMDSAVVVPDASVAPAPGHLEVRQTRRHQGSWRDSH